MYSAFLYIFVFVVVFGRAFEAAALYLMAGTAVVYLIAGATRGLTMIPLLYALLTRASVGFLLKRLQRLLFRYAWV